MAIFACECDRKGLQILFWCFRQQCLVEVTNIGMRFGRSVLRIIKMEKTIDISSALGEVHSQKIILEIMDQLPFLPHNSLPLRSVTGMRSTKIFHTCVVDEATRNDHLPVRMYPWPEERGF